MAILEKFAEVATGATDLSVRIGRGDVTVRAREGGPWSIRVESREGELPRLSRDGDRLIIEQETLPFRTRRMDIVLEIPASVDCASLETGHGECSVSGTRGACSVRSGHGDLSIADVVGECDLNTGHGEIRVTRHTGGLVAETGHGDITIDEQVGAATLRTGHGDLAVTAAVGGVALTSGHGGVMLRRSIGPSRIQIGHGEVTIEDAQGGHPTVQSGMGDVIVRRGTLKGLSVQLGQGRVACDALCEAGTYEIATGMGDIEFGVVGLSSARVEAQTNAGSIVSDVPLVRVGRSGPMSFGGVRMVGAIGDGEPRAEVTLKTGRGSIAIRNQEGGTVQARDDMRSTSAMVRDLGPAIADAAEAAGISAARALEEAWSGAKPSVQRALEELTRAARERSTDGATRAIEEAARAAEVAATRAAERVEVVAEEFASRVRRIVKNADERVTVASGSVATDRSSASAVGSVDTEESSRASDAPPTVSRPWRRPTPIEAESGAGAKDTAPATPRGNSATPQGTPDPTVSVLEALACGEITVEEAHRKLDAARN
ncbi:MAG: hypothetical protein EPO26_02445 [Chloroflexota bacterium]|nr:MAG: hypothetical protein EPO26_02445 [Chloroflexota bacterium]